MRRHDKADHEYTVLLPTFHDIAGLNKDLLVAKIFEFEFIDLAGLAHAYGTFRERFLQGEGDRSGHRGTVDQVDREIAVAVRSRNAIIIRGMRTSQCRDGEHRNRRARDGQRKPWFHVSLPSDLQIG